MDKSLLEILCCPASGVPVDLLDSMPLAALNRAISAGTVRDIAGTVLQEPLREALLTRDRQLIYRVDDGIPVMLVDQAIRVNELDGLVLTTADQKST